MAAKPRLLTSECAAHYPRLWALVENFSDGKRTRKYPVALNMITFSQEFEMWVLTVTDHISDVLQNDPPVRRAAWSHYGADPLVAERLDYFAENINKFLDTHANIGKTMLEDLQEWHRAILMRTNTSATPKYMTTIKCQSCRKLSVIKHGKEYWCSNIECGYSWQV
jgi:hypothetical protein